MKIEIFEVGPRDGLQNENRSVKIQHKKKLIMGLLETGLKQLEIGAYVRPDRVPQMADTRRLVSWASRAGIQGWYLVPNRRGFADAMQDGVRKIALFTATSETFVKKNMGMNVRDSYHEFARIVQDAKLAKHTIKVRGYLSTAFGCPFEGWISPAKTLRAIEKLLTLGIEQVSVGDTIGVATPKMVEALFKRAVREFGAGSIAGHFHDTRGTALANAFAAIHEGVITLDASVGGLGGCPFAPGASGNLATEDLVYALDRSGVQTGVNLQKLCEVSLSFSRTIKRPLVSKMIQAYAYRQKLLF